MIPKRRGSMADSSEISQFLHEVRRADYIDFVPTEKNRHTRLLIGLTAYDQENIVRNLTVAEYYSGPSNDLDATRTGKVWVFKHNFEGHTLYIKRKEKQIIQNESVIKCLSCHIDCI